MDKKRAIEIALLYIPTMLGDEADLGITYKDLEEVPNVLKAMLNDYEQGRADAFNEIMPILIDIVDTEGCCYGHGEKIDELENQWEGLKENK